jgi:hypothetical protein
MTFWCNRMTADRYGRTVRRSRVCPISDGPAAARFAVRRRREVPRCPAVAWQHGEPTGSSSPDGDVLFARVRSIPEFVKVVGIAATWSSQQHRDARGGQMLPTWGAERTRRVNSLDSWLAPAPIWRPGPPHPGAARHAGAVIPRRRLRGRTGRYGRPIEPSARSSGSAARGSAPARPGRPASTRAGRTPWASMSGS